MLAKTVMPHSFRCETILSDTHSVGGLKVFIRLPLRYCCGYAVKYVEGLGTLRDVLPCADVVDELPLPVCEESPVLYGDGDVFIPYFLALVGRLRRSL